MDVLALLSDTKVITPEDKVSFALEATQAKSTVMDVLAKHGITGEVVLHALSEKYGIPARTLPSAMRILVIVRPAILATPAMQIFEIACALRVPTLRA